MWVVEAKKVSQEGRFGKWAACCSEAKNTKMGSISLAAAIWKLVTLTRSFRGVEEVEY